MHDYNFDLNDKNFCYVLGYLWADAYFGRRKEHLSLSLEIVKDDFLEIWPLLQNCGFKTFSTRMRKNSKREQAVCRFGRKEICAHFEEWGFLNRSGECLPYFLIDDKLKKFFIKGFLDGDGSISLDKNNLFRVCFNGKKDQSWSFLEDFCSKNGISFVIYNKDRKRSHESHTKDHKYSVFEFTKLRDRAEFCELIIDIDIGLKRKLNVYKKWKKSRIEKYGEVCPAFINQGVIKPSQNPIIN